MQAIITKDHQINLWKVAAFHRLGRTELAKRLNITSPTLKKVLDADTPIVVSSKTFTAVNDFLIEELSNK